MPRKPSGAGRATATVVENNFSRGLITEATNLNFPENAATDTWNCVFLQTGQVQRRKGIDIEVAPSLTNSVTDDDASGVVKEYVWQAVSTVGQMTFVVVQTGVTISFYLQGEGGLSAGKKGFTVDLTTLSAVDAATIRQTACSFASGNGYLFITHPNCKPSVVQYDVPTDSLNLTPINLTIRDFEGVDDGLGVTEQPATLSNKHWYNLKNQGWWKNVLCVDQGGGLGSVITDEDIPAQTDETNIDFLGSTVNIPNPAPDDRLDFIVNFIVSGPAPFDGGPGASGGGSWTISDFSDGTDTMFGSFTDVQAGAGHAINIGKHDSGTTFTASLTGYTTWGGDLGHISSNRGIISVYTDPDTAVEKDGSLTTIHDNGDTVNIVPVSGDVTLGTTTASIV